jgi:GST-like protein
VIELFTADTPNGKKISIMLEEIGYDYKVTKVDISKDEQFKPEFVKLSPFSKIPVITDHDNNESIFESGAILMYLGEKSGKFYDEQDRLKINQWLMAQMGTIGPMIGQHHQFHHYNPGKRELDNRLKESKFLAGENYTIADIATWPWFARHEWHDIGLKNYENLARWYLEIADREAVIKGYDLYKIGSQIPKI